MSSAVPAGTPLHARAGEMSVPWQEYSRGMGSPSAKASDVSVNGLLVAIWVTSGVDVAPGGTLRGAFDAVEPGPPELGERLESAPVQAASSTMTLTTSPAVETASIRVKNLFSPLDIDSEFFRALPEA